MRTIPSLLLLAMLIPALSPRAGAQEEIVAPVAQRQVSIAPEGPWGQLEFYEIPLEFPTEILSSFAIPSQYVEWVFQAATHEEMDSILLVAGLTSAEISNTFAGCTVIQDEDIFRVYPATEAVLSMPLETRTKLYRLLSQYSQNRFYRRPVYINQQNLSDWFRGSTVDRDSITDVSMLAYPTPNGQGFYLSDVAYTLRGATTALEERELLQGLLRSSGLIVRLRLSRESLTPGIADYWTAGYKNKAVMPLLESVVTQNDGSSIDIAHLIPALPRQYLNQFPDTQDGAEGRLPDWFWTCYNFFRSSPRAVYADSPDRDRLILKEFEPAMPLNQFGDLLLLNSGGRIIHGCIYIAADIVYTKNSPDIYSPWIFMRIEDVVGYHDVLGDVTISTFRKRTPLPEAPQ
jgi:hypothetical protein